MLVFLESQFVGSSGIWSDLDFAWLLSWTDFLSPFYRVVFAVLGGIGKGSLNQSYWWLEALAMMAPLLLFEKLEKLFFVEEVFFRKALAGIASLLFWFAIIFLGSFLDWSVRAKWLGIFANFSFYILILLVRGGFNKIYARLLR